MKNLFPELDDHGRYPDSLTMTIMKYFSALLCIFFLVGCSSEKPEIDPNQIEWEVDKMPKEELDKIINEMVSEIKSKQK